MIQNYLRKQGKSQINNLILHLKEIEKEKQNIQDKLLELVDMKLEKVIDKDTYVVKEKELKESN